MVENVRDNVKKNSVSYGVVDLGSTEYSSHALAKFMDGENRKYWILVTRSRIGK